MVFDEFYTEQDGRVCVHAEQASRFAKEVAGDLNPIHNPDARRFCVPGDLLFALVLARFGLYERMTFRFHSMVGDKALLSFQRRGEGRITVEDMAGKVCLEAAHEGEVTTNDAVVEGFARKYVAFSGLNFPHYLKPLFEEKGVMFNPQRPLVIYDSMDFALESLDMAEPGLEFAGSSLEVDGKRADALLQFRLTDSGKMIGAGSKKLIVSGLRPYDAGVMDEVVAEFYRLKAAFEAGG